MTLSERCDEIVRLIDETLAELRVAVDTASVDATPPFEPVRTEVPGPTSARTKPTIGTEASRRRARFPGPGTVRP